MYIVILILVAGMALGHLLPRKDRVVTPYHIAIHKKRHPCTSVWCRGGIYPTLSDTPA